jgi:hypothetical protein
MFRNVLLACSNTELREFLFDAITDLTDASENHSEIDEVRDAAAARSKLRAAREPEEKAGHHFDLVVIELHLPIERRGGSDRSRHIGLELLQELHEAGLALASVLLVDKLETRVLKGCQALPCCELLVADDDLRSGLEAALDRLSRLVASAPGNAGRANRSAQIFNPVATIEIDLPYKQHAMYRITGSRDAKQMNLDLNIEPQPLNIPWDDLGTLFELSRALHERVNHWELLLRLMGERLCDIINRGNFALDFKEAKGWCGGSLSNIHIRFNITPELYGLAFEALYDKAEGYLMLQAPVARRVRGFNYCRQLRLERDRPINILVVEANLDKLEQISGPDDPDLQNFFWHNELEHLTNTAEERRFFEGIRARTDQDARLRQLIGKITILSTAGTGDGRPLARAIKSKLTEPEHLSYDIVHFAGHSIFVQSSRGSDGRGFLILPGDQHPEALPIGEFADWLGEAGTQFVYLSSCRSSEADAAYALAGNRVPAVVGFRWDIEDNRAAEYAREFYKQLLFACPAFDEAFLLTRRLMHNRYSRNDRIWAAPMLILQPQEWHRYCEPVIALPTEDWLENPAA